MQKGIVVRSEGLQAPNCQLPFNEVLWPDLCIWKGQDCVISDGFKRGQNQPPAIPAWAGMSEVCI